MRRFFILIAGLFFLHSSVYADTTFAQRKDVQKFIKSMVKHHGFNQKQLTDTLNQVQLQPKIIESMERPYEKKNWDAYQKLFLTPQRLEGGIKFWKENQKTLEKAEKKYNIPANVIVAIIGVETLYGKHQGNYRVLDALSTLAFNYPKRSKFFKKELREYLIMCKELNIAPTEYLGSYAGAMGKPQFMPSSYRYYAVDFSGNGKKDLINDNADAIGSVANYFHRHGWKLNQGVAQPAVLKPTTLKKIKTNQKAASYSMKKIQAAGLHPKTAALNSPTKAGVIELTTDQGKEYWLAYHNFYVITKYNTSPQYALAVYLLSLQLKKQWEMAQVKSPRAYV